MVTITKGFTFSDTSGQAGNTCSAANLHTMVDSATFSNMALGDFKSSEKPIYISGSAPSGPSLGQLWWNPSQSGTADVAGILYVYNGSQFEPVSQGVILTAASTVSAGMPVAIGLTTDDTCYPVITINPIVIGVAAENIPQGSSGTIVTNGYVDIPSGLFASTPVIYNFIRTSAGATITPISSVTINTFGRVVGSTATGFLCLITGTLAR